MLKRIFKRIGIGFAVFIGLIIIFSFVLTIFHRVKLNYEQDKIIPIGQVVEVNGHAMHIYIEGNNENTPLLVFLAGSGTAAPVYDFKPLYSLLSDQYRIAVVEKAGYGYSGIADVSRDVDTMLAETREALSLIGEQGPYILLPHSMSGLEALRWAQLYPDEVTAIIGIDMAVPSAYENMTISASQLKIMAALTWMGVHRLSFVYPVSNQSLTQAEYLQAKLLTYRNALNQNMIEEGEQVFDNAEVVKDGGIPDIPILLLISDGLEVGEFWIPCQEEFARQSGAQTEYFDCGHYLHQHESEKVALACSEFIGSLLLLFTP